MVPLPSTPHRLSAMPPQAPATPPRIPAPLATPSRRAAPAPIHRSPVQSLPGLCSPVRLQSPSRSFDSLSSAMHISVNPIINAFSNSPGAPHIVVSHPFDREMSLPPTLSSPTSRPQVPLLAGPPRCQPVTLSNPAIARVT